MFIYVCAGVWCVRQIFQAPRSTNSSSDSTWAMPLSASLWCLMSVSSLPQFLPPTVFFSVIVFIILILVWRETSEVFNGGTPLCETSLPVFICSNGWPHSLGRGTLRVSEVQGCMSILTCIALTIPLFCWKYYFECWKSFYLKVQNSITSPKLQGHLAGTSEEVWDGETTGLRSFTQLMAEISSTADLRGRG